MSSSRGHKHSLDYKHDFSSDEDQHLQRSSRPRGFRPSAYREDSLIKPREAQLDKADSGWDTDYSPRDKYYLSESDDPHHLYSATRPSRQNQSRTREHSRERRSPTKHDRTTDYHDSSRRSPSPHKSPPHHQSDRPRSPSHSHHRRHEGTGDAASKSRSSTHAKPASAPHASRSRPRPSRAASSYLASLRPRPSRAASSYTGSRPSRPRPVRALSRNASYTKTKFPRDLSKLLDPDTLKGLLKDFPWDEAGKVAMQAGVVAAMKVGTDAMPLSAKVTKIGSAALGAAVVDHVFRPKKKGGIKYTALRHLTEVAVGNLVVGPAMGKADHSVQSRRRGRGKR